MNRENKIKLAQAIYTKKIRREAYPLKYFIPIDHPELAQKEVLRATNRNISVFGGNRSSKSVTGTVFVIQHCLNNPQSDWWAVTWADMMVPVLMAEYNKWLPKHEIRFAQFSDQRGFLHKIIIFRNGSRIRFKTYEQGWKSFQGASKDGIHCDEEGPEDVIKECKARLIDRNGILLRTMTPLNGLCFDDQTKILAKDGWKCIDELNIGDYIFTINQKTLELELKKVDYIYRDYSNKPMIKMECQGFSSLTTFDHRWFVKNKETQNYEIKTSKSITKNYAIPRTFINNYNPNKIYEDWYVSLLGWIITDGTYRKDRSQVMICQSLSYNPHKCKIIEQLINESGCSFRINKVKYHKGEPSEGTALHFTIKKDLAKRIIKQFPDKTVDGEFISKLTKKQQHLLYDSMILGDGSKNKDGHRFIAEKKYYKNIEALMMLCQLLGKRATYSIRQGKYYDVYIQNSNRYKPFTHISSIKKEYNYNYKGRVWCPHTENETVIAMRNGTSYISMNTYTYDEVIINQIKDKEIRYWYFDHNFNPHVNKEARERIIGGYADKEREVRSKGHFLNLTSGQAYYAFDNVLNIANWVYNPKLPLEVSCDFNVDLMSWNIGQSFNGKDFDFDYIELEGYASTDLMCKKLRAKYPEHKAGWIFYGDISGSKRSPESSLSSWGIIQQNFPDAEIIYQNIKNIKDRVDAVNGRLKNDRGRFAFISENMARLKLDLMRVTWEMLLLKNKAGKLTHSSDGYSYKLFAKYPLYGTSKNKGDIVL